jgi:hypothetical protein
MTPTQAKRLRSLINQAVEAERDHAAMDSQDVNVEWRRRQAKQALDTYVRHLTRKGLTK